MAAEPSTAASSGRSGAGGASADSYIGSLISLTSKSEIRYEGILYNINTEESSIGLRNVRSFGTEGRKKDGPQVPPGDKIYEYILFRGTDIKDLQVKASPPPVQTTPPINSDPAIIQSHYQRPAAPPTSLPTGPPGSLADLGPHSAPMGLPGPNFQTGPPSYQQPGGNLNSWGPTPPNANGSGLPMPMYWQGFYGAPNVLPQLPQQSLLRPPLGMSITPPMQQMQFSGFNSSLPTAASSLPSSSLPDHHSSFIPNSTSSSSLPSSSFPASTLSLNLPPMQPVSSSSEIMTNLLPNKAPVSTIPSSIPSSGLPSLAPFSAPDNAGTSSITSKSIGNVPTAVPQQTLSQPVTSNVGTSGSGLTETPTPSLITPGHLLQSGPSTASAPQSLQTTHKDVEVVQVSSKPVKEPSAPVAAEAQPPILPLPPNARAHKPNGGPHYMRNNYRGRGGPGGRGSGNQRPIMKFTEDFDFMAMNEKFNKDEVWGHLGKGNRSQSNDNEGNGNGSDEEDREDEDNVELPNVEVKPIYNKDDFFDSLSSNALNNDGRTRYSEQIKLDTETFGEYSRYRGGRGGRGPYRGGGRYRGSSYGRGGYGGYGYVNRGRGRGRGMQSPAPQ
ncbi:protein decapping 5-like [Salvia hispanica]|uniref:protein decapping 5-like n=1 Tax=Salvia hispanica TaxID=49212 RepID=UPI002009C90B|nr:protein decapping 5-like [Salvia hispanica]XP_047959856.1 protein decapping 5-like [Salvia hispanica]